MSAAHGREIVRIFQTKPAIPILPGDPCGEYLARTTAKYRNDRYASRRRAANILVR